MPVIIALPELLALAGLFLALGMVVMGDQFTKALFQVTESGVGWIPWVGKKAAGGVKAVGKRVNAVFSHAAIQLEGAISSSWHVLANLIEQTGQAIWDTTRLAADVYWYTHVRFPLDVLSALARKGAQAAGVTQKVGDVIVRRYYVTKGVTAAQLSRFGRRLHTLEARVAALPVAAAGAIALPFPRLGSLERKARTQGKRLTRLERRFGTLAFTAAVAAAIGRLGLGWARCTNVRKTGRALCGMDPTFLEMLLAGGLLIVGGVSLRELAIGLQGVADEANDAVLAFIRDV